MVIAVETASNPLVPSSWAFGVLGVGLLAVVLFVAALVSIVRSGHLGGTTLAVWVLIVLAFPFLGALLWFVVGRRSGPPAANGQPGSTTADSGVNR